MSNLRRLSGGIMARERAAWAAPCPISECGQPAAGIIDSLSGPVPVCADHIPGAEERGYTVRRGALS
jgi:hypothetical protein